MANSKAEYTKLPPGWDCKFDNLSGKWYYINHLTKTTQFEDPRNRYKPLQNERCSTESIPMQPMHGSPYHVYPASNFPAVKAFQAPNSSLNSISASPLLSSRSQTEMSPIFRHGSPQPAKIGILQHRQLLEETSFSNQGDTDVIVNRINNMFPTAGENHIRLLLKKYYNREAVVVSALQVDKYPLMTPATFSTPPAQRHLYHSNSAFQMTPPARRLNPFGRTDSPLPGRPGSAGSTLYGSPRIGEQFRPSPKPHSSPKMKLRYLKTVFPKADETIILDILANSDNNVQRASEKLIEMGYSKQDILAPKLSNRQPNIRNQSESSESTQIALQPKILSTEEKNAIKLRMQSAFKDIAERIILMALESVDYSESRAAQILDIVMKEDADRANKGGNRTENAGSAVSTIEEEPSSLPESKKSEPKQKLLTAANRSAPSRSSPESSSSQPPQPLPPSSLSSPQAPQLPSTSQVRSTRDRGSNDTTPTVSTKPIGSSSDSSSPSSSSSTSASTSACSSSFVTSPIDETDITKKNRSKVKSEYLNRDISPKVAPIETGNQIKSVPNDDFKSYVGRLCPRGHNKSLCKGPNDTILLTDYITWNGANPDVPQGRKGLAVGTDPTLKSERTYSPQGHNSELCKGPNVGIAKGSIYSQLIQTLANVKCN